MKRTLALAAIVLACGCEKAGPKAGPQTAPPPPASGSAATPAAATPGSNEILSVELPRDPVLPQGTMALMGGRLTIRPPPAMANDPRGVNIMDAPRSSAEETRLRVEHGDRELVILAREMFQTEVADLATHVVPLVHATTPFKGELDVAPFTVADTRLRVLGARPKKLDTSIEAVLLLSLLVVHPDKTLQQVSFYVSPAAARDKALVAAMEAAAPTLAVGPRALDRGGGRRRLGVLGGGALVIDVPRETAVTMQDGEDFFRYRFLTLAPIGRFTGKLVIQVDPYPDKSQGTPEGVTARTEAGVLLGEKIDWTAWNQGGGVAFHVLRPLPGRSDMYLDIGGYGATDGGVSDALRHAIETMTFVR